jgi:TolB protein
MIRIAGGMHRGTLAGVCVALLALTAGGRAEDKPAGDKPENKPAGVLKYPEEAHFGKVRQLTFGGQNAEAYYSADGRQLIFQRTPPGEGCDQIFKMDADGSNLLPISSGRGRCTCSYFAPDGKRLIYASTFEAADTCPAKPDYSQGYVWAVYPTYNIYSALPDGSDLKKISDRPGYNAECVYSPDGSRILFTSDRDGDLELYTMKPDGSDVRRITHALGYDGGGFFSPDGSKIVFRAHHYEDTTAADALEYKKLLAQNLVKPSQMEIFVCNADGSDLHQVTKNGAANFAPFWHPDGKRIIFSSNQADAQGRNFDLYLIHEDGTGQERITYCPEFDAFPMFSPDGRHLVFASNRNGKKPHETNIFVADWKE